MLNKPIEQMDFKELRKTVQELSDTIAFIKREYGDILYNIDESNFSSRFVKEKNDMKAEILFTANAIQTKVSKEEMDETKEAIISQTSTDITLAVNQTKAYTDDACDELSSRVTLESDRISAIVKGEHTGDILNSTYFTGIVISPNAIKMTQNKAYSIYSSAGLCFYEGTDNQKEGWAIEPDSSYGGELRYYVNGAASYAFGTGMTGNGVSTTDMTIRALSTQRGGLSVDVTASGNKKVAFVGLSEYSDNSPSIYANNNILATQKWVENNVSIGTRYAVFA